MNMNQKMREGREWFTLGEVRKVNPCFPDHPIYSSLLAKWGNQVLSQKGASSRDW